MASCKWLELTHLEGQVVRAAIEFKATVDDVIANVDPTTVRFRLKKGSATPDVYTHGVDAEVIKDAVGQYHMDIATAGVSELQTWYIRAEGVGVYDAAIERSFKVDPGNF